MTVFAPRPRFMRPRRLAVSEMLAESYARLYGIAQTGLRFFTVYGTHGRPDMAYYIFIDKVMRGEVITLFAPNEMQRDFTYIDDITNIFPRLLSQPPKMKNGRPHEIYNLGNSAPLRLYDLVSAIEQACGKKAKVEMAPKQPGDVSQTFAMVSGLFKFTGFLTPFFKQVARLFSNFFMVHSISKISLEIPYFRAAIIIFAFIL